VNKYKEALETISGITCMNYTNDGEYCVGGLVGDEFQKEIETLRELIDNYQEECDYHGEVLHDKEEEIAKLNKALDDAVRIIYMFAETNERFRTTGTYARYYEFTCGKCKLHSNKGCKDGKLEDEECFIPKCYSNWKEWLLHE